MSLLDLHGPEMSAAAPLYVPPPPKPRRAWGEATALFRGAGEGLTQIGASMGAVLAQGDSTGGMMPDLGRASRTADVDAERALQRGRDLEFVRAGGRSLRPDEAASTAEQVLYGMSRAMTKIVGGAVAGGVPGILAVSGEEAFTQTGEAVREGVDPNTAAKLGLVQGAGLSLAALPIAGHTLRSTLALYAAGGPGGFVAQQALTKDILERAGYTQRAEQVDVLDPVGLAVSALVPAPFAVMGLRAARHRRAFDSLPKELPREGAAPDVPAAGPMPEVPFERTATSRAYSGYPREATDAALVLNARYIDANAREAMAGRDAAAGRAHDAALARAEEQMQRGEPVSVADLAPALEKTTRAQPMPDGVRRVVETFGDNGDIQRQIYVSDAAPQDGLRVLKYPDGRRFVQTVELPEAVRGQGVGQALYTAALSDGPLQIREQFRSADAARVYEALTRKGVAQVVERDGASFFELRRPATPAQQMAAQLRAAVDEVAAELPDIRQALDDITAASRIAAATDGPARAAVAVEPAAPRGAAPRALEPGSTAETEAAATVSAAPARLADIEQRMPDLMIKLDDGSMVKASEFLEAAKADAAREAQEADLVDAAVQCALLHGL